MSQDHLNDRVVIITGAGKGLGRAYAIKLASLGARVVVNNRLHPGVPSSAQDTVDVIQSRGGVAVAEHSDASDPDCGRNLMACALENYGELHTVIANAGIAEGRSFHKQSLDDYRQVMEINLFGTAYLLHPIFSHFYDHGGGNIIVSSSSAGLFGEHGLPAYSSAKAALLGLMYSLHLEGAPKGIRVNALAPFATTQMTQAHMPDAIAESLIPDRVAPVAAWLSSPQCSVSGEIIVTGAGRMARAKMFETQSLAISDHGDEQLLTSVEQTWNQLNETPVRQSYRGALKHFAAFYGGVKQE